VFSPGFQVRIFQQIIKEYSHVIKQISPCCQACVPLIVRGAKSSLQVILIKLFMKKIIQLTSPVLLVVLCAVMFSFAPLPGAHNYQVLLDGKLIIEQYTDFKKEAPSVSIDPQADNKELSIRYSECGRAVNDRVLILKDNSGKLLKEWKFEGPSKGLENPMTIKVKDVTALKQKGNNTLKLYYASREFQEGTQIVSLKLGKETSTASN
jgi:hypothetical protein